MRRMQAALTLTLVLGTPALATAQAENYVLTLGSGEIDASFMTPYKVVWSQVNTVDGKSDVQRLVDDEVELLSDSLGDLLVRTQDFKNLDGTTFTVTNVARFPSLVPVSAQLVGANGTTQWDFSGGDFDATGVGSALTPASHAAAEFENAPFDQRLGGLLFAAAPLETGYSASFPFVRFNFGNGTDPTLASYEFSVAGREPVTVPGLGELDAWVVETNQSLTFWVSRQWPYILKVSFPITGGESVFEIARVLSGE